MVSETVEDLKKCKLNSKTPHSGLGQFWDFESTVHVTMTAAAGDSMTAFEYFGPEIYQILTKISRIIPTDNGCM